MSHAAAGEPRTLAGQQMRFVTWNLGRTRRTHAAAWRYLLDCLKPDVALVQEALSSADSLVVEHGSVVWCTPRRGGTGVFVRHGMEFTRLERSVKGSYVAAVSIRVLGRATQAISVHVGPESWRNQVWLRAWLLGQLSDGPLVVGGDFNVSREYSAKHKAYLSGLSADGFHDCHFAKQGEEKPSFWGWQSGTAKYQDDHFFTSPSLGSAVRDCDVVDNALTRLLSDHGPITLDLNSGAG
jgi:endonuclease/exonuclease/phosphatase family metal-dependent hydrolase